MLGRSVAWLALALVLLTFLIVVLRYLFNVGSVALQESLLYLHSLIFLMGAAYTCATTAMSGGYFYRPMSAFETKPGSTCSAVFLLILAAYLSLLSPGNTLPALGLTARALENPAA